MITSTIVYVIAVIMHNSCTRLKISYKESRVEREGRNGERT